MSAYCKVVASRRWSEHHCATVLLTIFAVRADQERAHLCVCVCSLWMTVMEPEEYRVFWTSWCKAETLQQKITLNAKKCFSMVWKKWFFLIGCFSTAPLIMQIKGFSEMLKVWKLQSCISSSATDDQQPQDSPSAVKMAQPTCQQPPQYSQGRC